MPRQARSCLSSQTLGVMKLVLTTLLAATVAAGCTSDHTNLQRRKAEWKTALDSAIPSGTSVESVKRWGEKTGVSFTYLEKQRQLYAIAERIPEAGFNRLVCSEWSVILKVTFSETGISEKNEVGSVGTCL